MTLTAISIDSVIFYSCDFLRQGQCSLEVLKLLLEVIQMGQITQLSAPVSLVLHPSCKAFSYQCDL